MLLAQRGLTDEFLADKIKSLLDARQTLYFQRDGVVTDQREIQAIETQRKTAELAAKLKGHLREQPEVNVEVGLMAVVIQAMHSPGGELYKGNPQDIVDCGQVDEKELFRDKIEIPTKPLPVRTGRR